MLQVLGSVRIFDVEVVAVCSNRFGADRPREVTGRAVVPPLEQRRESLKLDRLRFRVILPAFGQREFVVHARGG